MKFSVDGKEFNFKYIISDYTGTLSEHSKLIPCVKEKIHKLKNRFEGIIVLTADTMGSAEKELSNLNIELKILNENTAIQKREFIESLGAENCIALGNGNNDIEMFKVAGLSLAIVNKDGCNAKLIQHADLVFNSICDALDALINSKILISLLRN
ncbi:HAD family hydrolase [Hippea maritima]|uniref:Haloacid dehalogenase domain protein hydrolase type 3 n=1 Tax=Hippea maritima (strain ATCC 700847 / DSM 10411 / MH2) TaxID=760142 RepID=F2LUR0_HIPMA|nr:HAD hydrolase family protein [Hippea maritima]AEA33515.1 Haloacid dehalogenase domain protein hydrolase type 3 [Hippea maritima DSM 10411]